jgi:FkbH-like protein
MPPEAPAPVPGAPQQGAPVLGAFVRKSAYAHLLNLGEGRVLAVHALTQLRLAIDTEVATIIDWFAAPRRMPAEIGALQAQCGVAPRVLAGCLAALMEHGLLTDKDPDLERAAMADRLAESHGRDPGEALDGLRRVMGQGADANWAVTEALGADALGRSFETRWNVLMFGDCELQMEADFLRRAAARHDIDLRVGAGFPNDLRLAGERDHQAILVGALRSRRMVALGSVEDHGGDPAAIYLTEARQLIEGLRRLSAAPILIDTLPEPTVQPLGLADRGVHGHRNRFRRVNLGLETLAEAHADVYVVDIAAALNAEGSARLLDDGLVGFTHFGSAGWMLQRPRSELAAVHGLFPDPRPLADFVGGSPYRREAVAAEAHLDALRVVLGHRRKKCVILDLDGTLWPGVLAETGAPFAWTNEVSGPYSYIGLYFGLHEALKTLKRRGIVLACVSKNDEALVRDLWRYPAPYPHDRLLSPDDFVTMRINWADKPGNIRSIANELGFALDAFIFIDDHPLERERVRQALPEVEVWGEDPFALRRRLLTDPRLQAPRLTAEAGSRTALVKSQLDRDRQRGQAGDEDAFLAALGLECRFEQPSDGDALARVVELFERTTQFNTTGKRFSAGELARHAAAGEVFVAHACDRFGDYGLVAAAVLHSGEITAFAMSCRVIGLKVEARFLQHLLSRIEGEIIARIVPTDRNGPVRHLYADNGFRLEDGVWRHALPLPHRE